MREPCVYLSPDVFLFTPGVLPRRNQFDDPGLWRSFRKGVFDGFFRSVAAFAEAGNLVIADIVLEDESQFESLRSAVADCDVLFIGLHCPLEMLQERETARGDRQPGDAARDFTVVHTFSSYDLECEATQTTEENVRSILEAWGGQQGAALGRGADPETR